MSAIMFCGAALPLSVISLILLLTGKSNAPEPLLVGLGIMFFGTATVLVLAWVWAAVTHGMLRITGGCEYGMSRTVQCILYSCGTQSALAVPIVGLYCGSWIIPLWWIVAAIVMVTFGQRVHGGRATLAVLTFPGVILAGFAKLWFLVVFSALGTMSTFGPYLSTGAQSGAVSFAAAINQYAATHDGTGPGHAALLMTDSATATSAAEFVIVSSGSDETLVPAGDETLMELQLMPTNRQALATQQLADALPPNVVAHRFGDFVFTYHGIDFNAMDSQLWTVVASPDPAFNPNSFVMPVIVGKVDGSVQTYSQGTFVSSLAAQNALRKTAGLPPLSDPRLVTHESPMTAASSTTPDSDEMPEDTP
jgi:hypothetical protein